MTVGVGFIGAGPVTQAIHLPTLATLADRLHVAHVMDVDEPLAAAVATRVRARSTTDVDELLADPAVDVVAICSPHGFHAEQVEAACAAGKRAILCEKPLAVDDDGVARIVAASQTSDVPVVVGTMHVYDPAVAAATQSWGALPETAHLIRSVIVLPPNERFIDVATDLEATAGTPNSAKQNGAGEPDAATLLSAAILGLATHNLPIVRQLAPSIDAVAVARVIRPFGYDITYRSGGCTVQLLAAFLGHWRPDWTLEAWGDGQELHVAFPPSYVLAGSATSTLRSPGGDRRWRFADNGYQAEWRHVADVAEGRVRPRVPVDEAAADLRYATALADAAIDRALETA